MSEEKPYPFWNDYAWDVETYPNIFTAVIVHIPTRTRWIFEVSSRIDQSRDFIRFVLFLKSQGARMVGFNSEHFDYPVIHQLLRQESFTAREAFEKGTAIIAPQTHAMACFMLDWGIAGYPAAYVLARDAWKITEAKSTRDDKKNAAAWYLGQHGISREVALECGHMGINVETDKFTHSVWASDRIVAQVDLYKIHHFDNNAKRTSLKAVEIAMKMTDVEDLPFAPGEPVPEGGFDVLVRYNCHDVEATVQLAELTGEALEFRAKLSAEYGMDMTNFNDTKIGHEFFRMKLEQAAPGCTGTKKKPKQTPRPSMNLGELIVPYARFNRPEFQAAMNDIAGRTITHTKDVLKGVKATIDGFKFGFGTGGIHGSVENKTFYSRGDWLVIDFDVASYYPNLAIANGFRPAHLGDTFNQLYKGLYEMRLEVGKKTLAGEAIKLALNGGVYGNSNSKFSPFYDPAFTMSITINGQLLLCMLAEWMLDCGNVHMIQANTDGITVLVHKSSVQSVYAVANQWQRETGLELEDVTYDQMSIRDVNNYLATYQKGGELQVKRIGAYAFKYKLHQNPSATVLARAASDAIVYGVPVADTILRSQDPFEFLYRYKGQRRDIIVHGGDLEEYHAGRFSKHELKRGVEHRPIMAKRHNGQGQVVQRTGRYYLANLGEQMWKIMPPLPKDPEHARPQAIEKGIPAALANRGSDFDPQNLNYGAYIDKAQELVKGVGL